MCMVPIRDLHESPPLLKSDTISLHADFKERNVFDWPSVLDSVHLAKRFVVSSSNKC